MMQLSILNLSRELATEKKQCFQNYYCDHQVDFLEKDSPGKEIEHRV